MNEDAEIVVNGESVGRGAEGMLAALDRMLGGTKSANEELWRIVYECAGAATRPLLEDHPHYIFPSERVAEAVREVMVAEGFTPPVGYDSDRMVDVIVGDEEDV